MYMVQRVSYLRWCGVMERLGFKPVAGWMRAVPSSDMRSYMWTRRDGLFERIVTLQEGDDEWVTGLECGSVVLRGDEVHYVRLVTALPVEAEEGGGHADA